MRYVRIHTRCATISTILTLLSAFVLAGEERDAAKEMAFFESRIRPLLSQYCFECHSVKSGKAKGHLRVDSRAALLAGGESGPALDSTAPEKSLLLRAIRYEDENTEMPPKGKLPPAVIEDLTRWVKMGAPWPDDKSAAPVAVATGGASQYEKLRAEHWCWQPVKMAEPPVVQDRAWPQLTVSSWRGWKRISSHRRPMPKAAFCCVGFILI
jgi:hypothetical protein